MYDILFSEIRQNSQKNEIKNWNNERGIKKYMRTSIFNFMRIYEISSFVFDAKLLEFSMQKYELRLKNPFSNSA